MSMIEHEIEQLEALKTAMQLDVDMGRTKAHGSIKNRLKVIDNAIDTIKAQSEKLHAYAMERSSQYYHDGWIPCNERLPLLADDGYSDCYIVYTDSDNICMAYWCGDDGWVFAEATNSKIKIDWAKVIAWRPLPEPYKGERLDE